MLEPVLRRPWRSLSSHERRSGGGVTGAAGANDGAAEGGTAGVAAGAATDAGAGVGAVVVLAAAGPAGAVDEGGSTAGA